MSNPSVNRPQMGASRSRALTRLPRSRRWRARLWRTGLHREVLEMGHRLGLSGPYWLGARKADCSPDCPSVLPWAPSSVLSFLPFPTRVP